MRRVRSPLAFLARYVPSSTGWEDVVFGGRHKAYGAYQLRRRYPIHLICGFLAAITLCLPLLLVYATDRQIAVSVNELSVVYSQSKPLPPPPGVLKKTTKQKRPISPKLNKPTTQPKQTATRKELIEPIEEQLAPGSDSIYSVGAVLAEQEKAEGPNTQGHEAAPLPEPSNPLNEILYVRAYTKTSVEIFFRLKVDSILRKEHTVSKYPNPYARDVKALFGRQGYVHQHAYVSLVKVSEGCAINIPKIYEITQTYVTLEDGVLIPIEAKYFSLLIKRVQVYVQLYGRWKKPTTLQ